MKRSNSLPKNVFTSFNDKIRLDDGKRKVIHNKVKYRPRLSLNKNESNKGHTRKDLKWQMKEIGVEEEQIGKEESFRVYNCLPSGRCRLDVDRRQKGKEGHNEERQTLNQQERFYHHFNQFFMDGKVKGSSNVVVRSDHTMAFIRHNEDYKFGDVLWLILKAYLAGSEGGSDDGALQHNLVVNQQREHRSSILDKLSSFSFPPAPDLDPMDPSPQYWEHLSECVKRSQELLKEWDEYECLFPHCKAMISSSPLAYTVLPRVLLLTAFVRTTDDLSEKIVSLGTLLGAQPSQWPHPLQCPTCVPFEKVYETAASFVGRTLAVKGMKKVFSRISSLCEGSLSKACLFLHLPPQTYAQAAKRSISKEDPYCISLHSDLGREMIIPSPLPLLVLLEKMRLSLLEKWLERRAEAQDAHFDALTMETLIEDSRDCLEQAVSLRKSVVDHLSLTCSTLTDDTAFDDCVLTVFKKYVWYIGRWMDSHMNEGRETGQMLSRLEDELGKATRIALSIPSASTQLCKSLISACTDVLRKTVLEEWQNDADEVNERAATYDLQDEDDEDEWDDPSVLYTCRSYNTLLRKVQDRTTRVLALIRKVVDSCTNGETATLCCPLERVSRECADFVLVEGDLPPSLNLLIDVSSVDTGRTIEVLGAVGEGRRIEGGGTVILLSTLPFWYGRRTQVNVSLNESLQYVIPLINHSEKKESEKILLVGESNWGRLSPLVEGRAKCSSHDLLNQQLTDFSCEMIEIGGRLHSFVSQLSNTFSFSQLSSHQIPPFRFTMMRAFDLVMQMYRELFRLLVPSLLPPFTANCVSLITDWRRFLEQSRPYPSKDIPLWAMPALTFIHTVAHPQITRLLPDEMFQQLRNDVIGCERMIGGSIGMGKTGDTSGGVPSPRIKRENRSGGETREERMKRVTCQTDDKVRRRTEKAFVLGKEVDKKREDYTLHNYIDPYRRAVSFKWRMLEKIGSGGFGVVHKAVREDGNGLLAVKIIQAHRDVICVLESEVAVMRDLHHDNVVRYFGAEVRGKEVIILMEYCPDGTLESICREEMDTALVRKYTNALLKAVSFIHLHHVVHRDIKPANIFLSSNSVLKLGDFGCARRLRGTETAVGEMKKAEGTFNYMAPEDCFCSLQWPERRSARMTRTAFRSLYQVLNGGNDANGYGRAADIWSVGCVVSQMISGHVPWEGFQWFHIVMRVGKGEKPRYEKPNTPKIVVQFLDSCFVYNPLERPSADSLLQMPFANVHDSSSNETEGETPNSP